VGRQGPRAWRAEKPDSQGNLLHPRGDYKQFLTPYIEEEQAQRCQTGGECGLQPGDNCLAGRAVGHIDGGSQTSPVGKRKASTASRV